MSFSLLTLLHSQHPVLRGVLLWSMFVCVASVVYVVFGMMLGSAIGVAIACAILYRRYGEVESLNGGSISRIWIPESWIERVALVYVFVVDALLIVLLWMSRTDDALQTPWYATGAWFFVLFAAATATLLWLTMRSESRIVTFAIVVHTFLIYGVALIVFRYGYGYDPLIHQAAEEYIVAHGRIVPLQPFYIGQYSVVTTLHFLTRLPVWLLDRALSPLLASISLPFVARYGFANGYDLSPRMSQTFAVLISLLPIPFLTFTVPYNLTVLYLLWWVLLAPCGNRLVLGMIALATTVTHPLLGAPLLIASIMLTSRRRSVMILSTIGIAVSIPLLLGIYRVMHGLPLVTTWAFWGGWREFVALFQTPFDLANAQWYLVVFYRWVQALPWVIVIIGLIVQRGATLFLGAGLFVAMYLTRTMIDLPGIVPYEQMEFVLRLRETIPIVFLPAAIVFIARWIERIPRVVFIVVASALLTVSWYATYPAVNAASMRVGWNVAAADFVAVDAISADAAGEPYVVLTDRMLAAAALRKLGFTSTVTAADSRAVFRYALEPDLPLFAYADRLLYYGLTPDDIAGLHQWFPDMRLYVAIHDYWYRGENIAEELATLGATPIVGPPDLDIFVLP